VRSVPATASPRAGQFGRAGYSRIRLLIVVAWAGFRRYSTYRQATFASVFTNTVFAFLRCYVLLAAAAATRTGSAAGYTPAQLALYCWASQGLIGVVMLWGWNELSDRIRSGDVVSDLLRPTHPVATYLAIDLGRAGIGALLRFGVPIGIGAIFFRLYVPQSLATYPLFVISVLCAVIVSFGCRFLVNASSYWLLDARGVTTIWLFCSAVLAGLVFPLHFLPGWLTWTLWVGTPFPSILQAPLDVLVERGDLAYRVGVIAGQAAWAAVVLGLAVLVQRRAERKLVIQGG
jgi:ABC-2 type transport system permease protein